MGKRAQPHDHAAVLRFVHHQFRFAPHHVHRMALGIDDVGMASQRVETGQAEVELLAAVEIAPRGHGGDGVAVLREQVVHRRGFGAKAAQGDAAPLRPGAVLVLALFAHFEGHRILEDVHHPHQPGFALGGGRAAFGAVGGDVGDALQGFEGILPVRHGRCEGRERLGAELQVFLGWRRLAAFVAEREVAQHFVALRPQPGEATHVGTVAQLAQQVAPLLGRGVEVVQPAARQAVEQRIQRGPARPAAEDAPAGLHLGGIVDELQHRGPVLRASRGAKHTLQQVVRLRSIDAHQSEQGQAEGAPFGKQHALARVGAFGFERLLQGLPCRFVLISQDGDQRPGGRSGAAHSGRIRREGCEHLDGVVEAALQDAHESDVRRMARRRIGHGSTGLDDGIRWGGRLHHMVQAAVEGLAAERLGQRLEQIKRQRFDEKAPIEDRLRVHEQRLHQIHVATNDGRAQRHIVLGRVVPRARAQRTEGVDELRKAAALVGESRERQGPGCIRAPTTFFLGQDDHAGRFELGVGLSELLGVETAAIQSDIRLGEDLPRLGDAERTRRERAVDQRHEAAGGRERCERGNLGFGPGQHCWAGLGFGLIDAQRCRGWHGAARCSSHVQGVGGRPAKSTCLRRNKRVPTPSSAGQGPGRRRGRSPPLMQCFAVTSRADFATLSGNPRQGATP